MKIEGLDKLQRELKDAQEALEALHGRLGEITCDPDDPDDVQRAIREMERLVDSKVSRYQNNPLVAPIVDAMKKSCREQMLQKVEEAKRTDS